MHKQRAIVVFSGQTDLAWLRVLRPGFCHCFVLLECPAQDGSTRRGDWVMYNPLSNVTQIEVWTLQDEEALRTWLVGQGHFLIDTYVRPPTARVLPWRPYTCVEAVKRALGLHAHAVFTPWQLHKYLKNEFT
ncbi:MAG: hypothetical protein JKY17_00545 [Magnetovibrio sp.]|nr:hypothetical protein [Magnetovibrio sp.]